MSPLAWFLPLQPLLGHCSVKEDSTVYVYRKTLRCKFVSARVYYEMTIWKSTFVLDDPLLVYISDNFQTFYWIHNFSMALTDVTEFT